MNTEIKAALFYTCTLLSTGYCALLRASFAAFKGTSLCAAVAAVADRRAALVWLLLCEKGLRGQWRETTGTPGWKVRSDKSSVTLYRQAPEAVE